MPGFDGTGPGGRGPATGRGRGLCRTVFGGSGARRSSSLMIAASVLGAAVNDIRKPDGFIRKAAGYLHSAVSRRMAGRRGRNRVELTDAAVPGVESGRDRRVP